MATLSNLVSPISVTSFGKHTIIDCYPYVPDAMSSATLLVTLRTHYHVQYSNPAPAQCTFEWNDLYVIHFAYAPHRVVREMEQRV